MAQEVVGSNPTTHPILPIQRTMGCRQAVRHQTLTLALVGSNPATPASFFDPLAQLVEHLTFNQVVRSSTLRRITKFFFHLAADGSLFVRVWRNWQTRQI